jgi:hypothetical protein
MALPETNLSRACRSIADFIQKAFAAASHPIQVRVGTPAAAQPGTTDTEHRLNLFFHRFEPIGFGSHEQPNEVWWIRVHCVITAFAVDEERISAGESDLRLIGEVLRLFHEQPVLTPIDVGGATMQAQMVLQPLGLDQIFQLWNTQGEVPYRPSLASEIALVPIVPREPAPGSLRVGTIATDVRAQRGAAPVGARPLALRVERRLLAAGETQIAFASSAGPLPSLTLELDSPELAALDLRVWIAGEVGAPVVLQWETWDPIAGWTLSGSEVTASVAFSELPDDASVPGIAVELPAPDARGQSALYASRTLTRPDGATVTLRSNPLLVTLFGGTP